MTDVRLAASTTPGHKLLRSFGAMTDVRLAHAPVDGNFLARHGLMPRLEEGAPVTDVRLAANVRQGIGKLGRAMGKEQEAVTDVRLVGAAWDAANAQIATGMPSGDVEASEAPFRSNTTPSLPALLVSYAYWAGFERYRARYAFRDFMLDSGAYSVHTSGREQIDLPAFIDFCLARMASDPQCVEIIQLDVLHDWRQGQRNLQKMWDAGVPAIPVWHWNEPEALLMEYAAAAPKIAVGVREKSQTRKLHFYEQVFARVWPCRIHGLAISGAPLLRALPFHSADATSWILGPAGYGTYKSMGLPARAPRGKDLNLKAEVQWWLKLERELKQRWAAALAEVEARRPPWPLRAWPTPAPASPLAVR